MNDVMKCVITKELLHYIKSSYLNDVTKCIITKELLHYVKKRATCTMSRTEFYPQCP